MPPPERQKNAARETRAINQYQLADCIGKGAFGAVYKALNMENGETVAIKQVKLSNIPRSELGVIMMEIDLLKKLNHPNIVKYNGFVKTKEYLNIILEFCENGSLTSIVKKFGKFPENLVAVYVVQVLEGLRYLHEQGVIHRDIKGANILTTKEGLVKLADFGVATRGAAPGSDAPVEEEAMVVGSPYWMAPEVIELSGATTASDVWSVGCTVIELLQGQPPYHDLAPMPALFRIVQDDHPPLPEGASGGLKDFLMQCFQKDYNLRVSAKKLLKHPWIQSARRKREAARETYGMNSMVNKFAEDVRSVQQWNAAINEPIHRHPFKKAIQQELDLNQPLQTANGRLSTGPQTSKDENWDADFADALSLSGNNLAKTSPGIFEYPSHEAKFSTSSTIAGTATSPLSSNTSLNDRASEMSRSPSPSKPPPPPGSLGIRKRLSAVDLAEQAEEAEDCWDNDFDVDDTEVAATRLVELKLRKSLETVQTMDGKINDRNKSTRENAPQGEKPKFNERDNDKQKNNERHVNDAPGQVHNRQDRVVSIDEDNTQTITMNFKKVLQAKLQPPSVKPAPSAAKPQTFISTSSATPVATATFFNPPVLAGASSLPPMLNFASSKYMESEADDVYDDVFAEEDEKILHEKLGKLNINFAGLKVGDTSRIKQRKPVAAPNETSRKTDAKQAWTISDARDLVMTTTLSLSTGGLLTTTVGASDPGASEITETPKTTATLPPNATKPSNLKKSNSPLSARLTTTPVATGSPKAISAFLATAARSHTTANTTTGDSPSGYKAAASRFFASFRDGRRNQPEQKVKSETSTEVTTATGDELTLRNRKVEHLMELDIFGDDEEEEEDERPVRKEDIIEDDEEGCDTIVLRPGRVGIGNLPRDVKGADLSKEEEHESEIPANRTGPLSRYAETDDDDYDDVFFGNSGAAGPAGMGLVNGELEKAELKIRSRARSFGAGGMNGSPNGESQFAGDENCRAEEDEEEDDDPFASLEEGMDEPDLEENVLRDKHARLCSEIESLIRQLQPEQAEDTVQGICDELLLLLTENPTLRSNVITYHGVIPIMELLEQRHQPSTTDRVSANVVQKLLRIVNLIIEGSIEIQENFCLVGGVPCVTAFASSKYPFYVRLEAARFVRRVCQASTLSLQMFVSGRGLRVLAGLLAGDYGEGKELVLTAIDGVASVFELQGPTPKNDFCRLFANCGLLEPLASALSAVSADRDPRAQDYVALIVHVLLIFSQADAKVKELVATRPVVKKILGELDNVPPAQTLGLVKCIKNLSMTSTALDTLEKAGAIETLAELLSRNSGPYITEMYNQVLNALYNLCRLNRRRQEAAAQAGVVPPLQRLVKTNSPLKQFALPVLCDLAHAGKICRGVLWQNDGLRFYLSLLGDPYWQINALEAVSAWLSDEEEKMRLEAILVVPGSVDALSRAFLTARTTGLEKLLDPLYKILVKAQGVARLLVERNGVAQKISERLKLPNAQVRLGVLRVLAALTETHPQPLALITKLGLQSTLHRLAAEDPGLLVRELAAKLAAGVKAPDPGTPIATPVRPRPEGRLPPVEKGKLRGG